MANGAKRGGELPSEIEELRRSEGFYRALFDDSPELVYVHDLQGRFLDANARALSRLGYTRDDIGALTFSDLLREEDVPRALASTRRIIEGECADDVQQYRLLTKDGDQVWVETSGVRLVRDGVPYAVLSFARDITERKRAEEALAASEATHRGALDSLPAGVVVHDADTNIVYCNPQATRLLGLTREQMMGKDAIDPEWRFVRDDGSPLPLEEYPVNRVIATRKILHNMIGGVDRPRTEDRVWVLANGFPVLDADGELQRAVISFVDITDIRRSEKALREGERRLANSQRTARVGSFEWDLAADTVMWSDEMYRMFGLDIAEHTPTVEGFAELVHPDDTHILSEETFERSTSGPTYEMSYRIIDQTTKQTKHIHLWGETTFGADGKPVHIAGTIQDITDRKRAEEALRESEEKFRAIFEQAPDSVVLVDTEAGRIVEFNSHAYKTLGYTAEEFQGLALSDIEARESPEEMGAHAERILKDGHDTFETRHRTKDGGLLDVSVSARTISLRGRSLVACIWTDVTEAKKAEEALRKSEESYRVLAESAADYIFGIGRDLTIEYVNEAGARALGKGKDEVLGHTVDEVFPPETAEHQRAALLHVLETGQALLTEAEHHFPDGKLWLGTRLSPLRNEAGDVVGVLGVSRDVTDRKQAEQAMQTLLKATAWSVGKGFFANVTTSLCDWLGVECAIVGEIADEDRVDTLSVRLDSESAEQFSYALSGTPCENVTHKGFCTYPKGITALFPEDKILVDLGAEGYVGTPLRGKGGNVLGVLCAISRRKLDLPPQAREVMEIIATMAAAEIERERAQRERKGLETQLRHTQKMEAIGTLAGGIAHDFNNLLQGILGYADLLKLRSKQGDETYEAADVIERAGRRAADLTQQLLGFARKGKHRDTPVDMHRIVGDVMAILSRTMDKRIVMTQWLEAEPSVTTGDPSQLEQVVMNLAVNARDAMPDGGALTFQTSVVERTDEPSAGQRGRCLLLRVSDTGIGMTAETRERIFEPFYTTRPQGEGTGMGLAMVYGIVANHGGTVQVHSEPGMGTSFDIFLPLAEKGARITDSQKLKAVLRGSGRILVVDDEETVRHALTDMLTPLGYEVSCACNGREAVEHYREHANEINLVLLDMTMPVMDGRECFEELRKINADVKVVIATGHALEGATQETMDAGALRFIHKPFVMSELAETVAKALAK